MPLSPTSLPRIERCYWGFGGLSIANGPSKGNHEVKVISRNLLFILRQVSYVTGSNAVIRL